MKIRWRNRRLRSDKKSRMENCVKSRQIIALHFPGGNAIADRAGIRETVCADRNGSQRF